MAAALLSGCQPAQTAQVLPSPVREVGYVILNGLITEGSARALIAELARLINAGARVIEIGINSPGGELSAAQWIVNYMKGAHGTRAVSFHAFNIGLVGSAACFVFLNAQERFAQSNSTFLFHAAGMMSTGLVSAQRLREAADRIVTYENLMRDTLRLRTRLPEGEREVYLSRTVVLSADDARRDGIADAIRAFRPPAGTSLAMIQVSPPGQRPAPPPAAPSNGS